MNTAIGKYPVETIAAYIALEIVVPGALAATLPISVPIDFAVAYGLNRLLRSVRRWTVDIALAAGISAAYPPISRVRISQLFARGGATSTTTSSQASDTLAQRAKRATTVLLDKYGLSWIIAQRIAGVMTTTAIFAALRSGVDVQSYLASFQYDVTTIANIMSSWTAAICLTAPFAPVMLYVAARAGTGIGSVVRPRLTALLSRKKAQPPMQ